MEFPLINFGRRLFQAEVDVFLMRFDGWGGINPSVGYNRAFLPDYILGFQRGRQLLTSNCPLFLDFACSFIRLPKRRKKLSFSVDY